MNRPRKSPATMEIKTLGPHQVEFPVTKQAWFVEMDWVGNVNLLNLPMLAIFSSAKCPASSILKAHDHAKELREGKTGVISGFHAPAEKEVLEVLLKGACPIVVVLGRRLKNARIPTTWIREIEKGRMLVISPFKEYQKYVTKEMSLQSNELAARIAGRVLVIHTNAGGGLQGQVEQWKKCGIHIMYLAEDRTAASG